MAVLKVLNSIPNTHMVAHSSLWNTMPLSGVQMYVKKSINIDKKENKRKSGKNVSTRQHACGITNEAGNYRIQYGGF